MSFVARMKNRLLLALRGSGFVVMDGNNAPVTVVPRTNFMARVKNRLVEALRQESDALRRLIDGNRMIGFVVWDASPPMGVTHIAHKLTIMEAIERASTMLQTDYADEVEWLVTGDVGRIFLTTLPHMVPGNEGWLFPVERGMVKIGRIGHRAIFYRSGRTLTPEMVLFNSHSRCCRIFIQNALWL